MLRGEHEAPSVDISKVDFLFVCWISSPLHSGDGRTADLQSSPRGVHATSFGDESELKSCSHTVTAIDCNAVSTDCEEIELYIVINHLPSLSRVGVGLYDSSTAGVRISVRVVKFVTVNSHLQSRPHASEPMQG